MIVRNDEPRDSGSAADADLILRTRSGDGQAFGELWRRHYPSGIAVARSITSSLDPDDLVQEAFTRIYQAILKGGGPNGSFRAYLFTSIRNTAAAWGRARRETAMDELESVPDPDTTEQASSDALDRGITAQAFRSLPTRWQEVLWYTEIEQMKPAEVAPLLGMKAGAVSQLAFRAREGLREAWIQAHLRSTASDSECHWTLERLGAYARGNLSTRDRKRADEHLEDCARCMIVAAEAKDVSSRLALVLLPLVLGVTGAAGYSALLQTGGSPVVAAAAMPSDVVSGGVVVGGSGAGLPVGVQGASAGGSGSTSGGAITGIGALVGAGSAALVVAGVVAAVAIVPGLVDAAPFTSLPSAGDADSSAISSDVAPDGSLDSDEKLQLDATDDAPKKKDDVDQEAETSPPTVPPVAEDTPTTPSISAESSGDGEGADQTAPTAPVEEEPATPTNPPAEGGETEPGNPGGGETEPGNPGGGETEPGGPGEGGETDPGDPPAVPTEPVTLSGTSIWIGEDGKTHYSVTVSGVPGATVQALINGKSARADQIILDTSGTGVIDLRPSVLQLLLNARVTIHYITDEGVLFPLQTSLWQLGFTKDASAEASGEALADESAPPALEPSDVPTEETSTREASAPAPEEPVVDEPGVDAPIVEAPAVDVPVVEAPVTEAPTVEAPVTEAPIVEAPVSDTSVSDAPPAPLSETLEPTAASAEPLADDPASADPAERSAPAE